MADGAFAQWPIFKSVNKLDDSTMKFENVGFPVREPMLAQGEVDAVFGFSMSSYINLKSRGVPTEDIVVLLMSDYGVDLYGNAIMVVGEIRQGEARGRERIAARDHEGRTGYREGSGRTPSRRSSSATTWPRRTWSWSVSRWCSIRTCSRPGEGERLRRDRQERFANSLEQIGLTFKYKNKPKVEDVFTEEFLPGADQRKVN